MKDIFAHDHAIVQFGIVEVLFDLVYNRGDNLLICMHNSNSGVIFIRGIHSRLEVAKIMSNIAILLQIFSWMCLCYGIN